MYDMFQRQDFDGHSAEQYQLDMVNWTKLNDQFVNLPITFNQFSNLTTGQLDKWQIEQMIVEHIPFQQLKCSIYKLFNY